MLKLAVGEKFDPRQIDRLPRRYDLEQVLFVMNAVGNRFFGRSEMIGDSTRDYRQYRLTFARFGGDRPFLKRPEYAALCSDQVELHARRRPKFFRRGGPDPRGREIDDLLLSGADYWVDITPPAVPPRPDDYDAPPAGNYGYPTRTLLKWGLAVDGERITNNARNTNKWLPAIPALSRMALDDGLLDGWPGEPASWAPHHAIHMLGQLQAHQEAGRLLILLERENDWLSDLLAAVWARMGPQAEPPLWDYLAEGRGMPEKRATIFLGLAYIAKAHPERYPDIVERFIQLLRSASIQEATANSYLVYVLDRMQATEAQDAIIEAFEQKKIDLSVIHFSDVELLAW